MDRRNGRKGMVDLKLTIQQTAPLLGEVELNRRDLLERTMDSRDRDLLVFPELALTGYSLRGRIQRLAVPDREFPGLVLPDGSPPVALGIPERGSDELVYNTAVLVHEGRIRGKHRKVYLPTYGLFDESRYFASGRDSPSVSTLAGGWKVGLLLCEDLWHPSLLYLLAMQGVELVLVLAAAPGRGEPGSGRGEPGSGPESMGPQTAVEGPRNQPPDVALFSSTERWELLARAAALQFGVFLAVANRAGVEAGITFAGGSFVVGPDGDILERAPQGMAAVLDLTLRRGDLRRARNPYSHLRDEDPAFLNESLNRLLGGA
jgi:predicted amidohydrolase